MSTQAAAAIGLFLTGAAFSQVLAVLIACWREAVRKRDIRDRLGDPAP